MGCSNCKKQQIVVVQNICLPSTLAPKNDNYKGNFDFIRSGKHKLDNESKLILSANTSNNRSQKFSSSASRNTSNESIRLVNVNSQVKVKNISISPIKDLISSYTIKNPTRNISNISCNRDSTKKVSAISANWLDNVSDHELKFTCFGENSSNAIEVLCCLLSHNHIIAECNNQICPKKKNRASLLIGSSCYKLTNEGLLAVKKQNKQVTCNEPTIEDAYESRRLRSIITKIVVVDSHPNPLNNLKIIRPSTQNSLTRFHIFFERVEVIDQLGQSENEVSDSKTAMLLILTFDYHSRASFDQIIAAINFGLKGKDIRVIVFGFKQKSSCRDPEGYYKLIEKTFEVNEDFAKLAFKSLGIEYFTLNYGQVHETDVEDQNMKFKADSSNDIDNLIRTLFSH